MVTDVTRGAGSVRARMFEIGLASLASRVERVEQMSMRLSDVENTLREAARDVDKIRKALEMDGEESALTRIRADMAVIKLWIDMRGSEIRQNSIDIARLLHREATRDVANGRRTLWQRITAWLHAQHKNS